MMQYAFNTDICVSDSSSFGEHGDFQVDFTYFGVTKQPKYKSIERTNRPSTSMLAQFWICFCGTENCWLSSGLRRVFARIKIQQRMTEQIWCIPT